MIRPTTVLAFLLVPFLACQDQQITTGCGAGALCALQITLVVTGQVRVSASPLVGGLVHVRAYQGSCVGAEVLLLPSPAEARTDSDGVYRIRVQPTQSAPAACLRVAYSDALFTDTAGIVLHVPPAAAETIHVNLTGP